MPNVIAFPIYFETFYFKQRGLQRIGGEWVGGPRFKKNSLLLASGSNILECLSMTGISSLMFAGRL
jgi:hypothetical protein